jgi:ABC-2 type transport system permease protein
VGLALLLGAAVAALITVTLVVTVSSDGIVRLMPILMYGLSGMIIPISLFPGWLQPLLLALPFPGLIDFPFRIYLGQASPEQIPLLLLHQLAWTGVLILVGRTLLSRVLRRMVVQGG